MDSALLHIKSHLRAHEPVRYNAKESGNAKNIYLFASVANTFGSEKLREAETNALLKSVRNAVELQSGTKRSASELEFQPRSE